MASALRIVCVFAVFCGGLRAAPTVTYDQRQNGEFNLRVDLDDVAVVLLPADSAGELFAVQRDHGVLQQGAGGKVHQLLAGRAHSRKKQKKPVAVDCTAEKPIESGPLQHGQSSPPPPQPSAESTVDYAEKPQRRPDQDKLLLVSESDVPAKVDGEHNTAAADANEPPKHSAATSGLISDPYSVTPSTPDISKRISSVGLAAIADSNMVVVKTVENSIVAQVNDFIEKNMETVKTSGEPEVPEGAKADVGPVGAAILTRFEENPISVSSADVKITGETAANGETVVETGEKSNETKAEDKADKAEVKAKITVEKGPHAEHKPATPHNNMIVTKTQDAPSNFSAEILNHTKNAANADTAATKAASSVGSNEKPAADALPKDSVEKLSANTATATSARVQIKKKTEEPTEMVAMKTVEKPTFAETLKANKKPTDAAKSAAEKETGLLHDKKPVAAADATIGDRSAENPSASAATTAADVQENQKKPVIEMVAMKTMEKPAFAEAFKAAKKPENMETAAVESAAVTETTVSVGFDKTPTEMVALKTADAPSNAAGSAETAVKSGVTTSSKPVEIVQTEDKSASSKPSAAAAVVAAEFVVTRSVPKPTTEMVAVKTIDNAATVQKTVGAVKNVVKPAGNSKTTLSSTGSSTVRKVADRNPLPSMTFEVATPKTVYT